MVYLVLSLDGFKIVLMSPQKFWVLFPLMRLENVLTLPKINEVVSHLEVLKCGEGILITIVLSKNNGFFLVGSTPQCSHSSPNVNEHKLISPLTAALSVVVESWMCFSDQHMINCTAGFINVHIYSSGRI